MEFTTPEQASQLQQNASIVVAAVHKWSLHIDCREELSNGTVSDKTKATNWKAHGPVGHASSATNAVICISYRMLVTWKVRYAHT